VSWRRQMREWAVARGRQAGRHVHRVSEQAMARARMAGQRLASKVISVQRAAGLPAKMIRRSARSVTMRPAARPADAAFREGYGKTIAARTMSRTPEPAYADPGPLPVRIIRTPTDKPAVKADPEAGQ
jgi:hypothetical protein